jgi:hypothetical protein
VEVKYVRKFRIDGEEYPDETPVILMNQPYASFAKAMIELQKYPDLLDANGQPIPPYDVTAHNLALLSGVSKIRSVRQPFSFPKPFVQGIGLGKGSTVGSNMPRPVLLYKSYVPSMDEGWTRWIFDNFESEIEKLSREDFSYQSVYDKGLRKDNLRGKTDTIVFPDQSPNQMLNGYAKGAMPEEYTGGIGKEGVANLRKFVENGGTLVFLNRASDFAIEQFDLPVRDVTRDLPRKDFYIPGSILRTEIDTTHPIARTMPKESIAWFEGSPAFEIKTDPLALANNFRIVASYPKNAPDILLSGWALGAERIAGKAALVEFKIGAGKIYLFGFRPQYRGQSLATFPLFFNALRN